MTWKVISALLRQSGVRFALACAIFGTSGTWALSQEMNAAKMPMEGDRFASPSSGFDVWRAEKLKQSARRHETVKLPGGSRTLQAFVVHAQGSAAVPVVLVIPEDNGLNNWARDIADQIAAMGYDVIVPDLLAGYGPNGGGQDSFLDKETADKVLTGLKDDAITADLNAWADYGKKLSDSNGKLAVVGFAWGAGRAFWFAGKRKDLSATFIFYDWAPKGTDFAAINAPVYGFYADNDSRVTNTLDATKAAMEAAGKKYEHIFYPGTDHMYIRLGEEEGNKNPANIEARHLSMARLQQLLKTM